MKPWILGCLASVVLVLGLFGGCVAWLRHASTYYVEAYKPHDVVEAGDEAALRARLNPFEFEQVTVFLEWNTYDNAEINVAPYKLFVVIEPRSRRLRSVTISSVSIESSLGHRYEVAPSTPWPIALAVTHGEKRVSHTFQPGFMFRFDEKEEISTRIEIQTRTEDETLNESLDIRWVPVLVKHSAPIV